MQLREYQTTALEQIRSSLEKGYKAPLLVLPTGAGKTVIFSELANDFVRKGQKVLILVHRRELIKQACQKLDQINVNYGVISSGFARADQHNLQVASVYTLYRNLKKELFKPDIIIFDEAHHVAAGTWIKIVEKYNQALKIGVTATPIRLDNKPLGKYFDYLIKGVQVQELVRKKYLCEHKVFAGNVQPDLSKLKIKRGDFQKKDLKEVMDQPFIIGDAVEQYKKHLLGKPAIAFCVDINHAKKVHAQFISEGVKSEVLTGEMHINQRDEVLDKLRHRQIDVVVSVDVISEGTDLPCVSGAILLRPTNSEALYMQQIGRILRPEKGKTAIVLDHVGNTYRHDFIDVEKNWVLEQEEDEGVKEKGKPIIITCKQCNFVFKQQKACPNCGNEITKKQLVILEGQLQELKRQREKDPYTIKRKYRSSKYNQNKQFHNKNLKDLESISLKGHISFEVNIEWTSKTGRYHNDDKKVVVGDNIIYYLGHNQQRYGIVLGFIDDGYETNYIHPYVVPPIEYKEFQYSFPDKVKEAMNFGTLQDIKSNEEYFNKIIFQGKSSQPYIYIESTKYKHEKIKVYLTKIRQEKGKIHSGYGLILLTDNGIEVYRPHNKSFEKSNRQVYNFYEKLVNFKQGTKVRQKMRKFKLDKFLLDNLIDICKKAHFNVGYNSDWVYRNYYARKLIKELQTIYK